MESVELRHSVFKIGCTGTCGAQPTVVGRLCCCLCLSVLHFISLLVPQCLVGDVRSEHPAATGVDGIARLRRPPQEEPWGAMNGSVDSAFSKTPASTFTSTSPAIGWVSTFTFLFFSLILFAANFQCKPPGRCTCTATASRPRTSSGEQCKFAFKLLPPEPHFHFYTDWEKDHNKGILFIFSTTLY